eukprot:gene14781-52812_t
MAAVGAMSSRRRSSVRRQSSVGVPVVAPAEGGRPAAFGRRQSAGAPLTAAGGGRRKSLPINHGLRPLGADADDV